MTLTRRTAVPYTRHTAATLPLGVRPYRLTGGRRGASAIPFPAAAASPWEARTCSSAAEKTGNLVLTIILLGDKIELTGMLSQGVELLKIVYANHRLEKYFSDFAKLKKILPTDWVKTIKKHMDRLEAAECFSDFLSLGLGRPEQLSGYADIRYSLRIAANARLIIALDATKDTIEICTEVAVEGVVDYHGDKENWYIS